jgi:flagellin
MLSARTNISESVALAAMARNQRQMNRSMERLATGLRINRASDDPSGLQVSERLKSDEIEIRSKIDGLDRESAMLGAREGAHSVIRDLVIDLKGLVVQGANRGGLGQGEADALQGEVSSILLTIDHLANTTRFGGEQIMSGVRASSMGRITRTVTLPDGTTEQRSYSLADLAGSLNLRDGDAEIASDVVDAAVSQMATEAGAMGAREQSLESEKRTLLTRLENTAAARSAITDTDFAQETSNLVRAQVLQQASQFMALFARQQNADMVLNLIKPLEIKK